MEKRFNAKLDTYISSFKTDICTQISDIGFENSAKVSQILEYIYEYDKLSMTKDDFIKRKRIKNTIPLDNRCIAKRANCEQCTRHRKDNHEYCGTHIKGTPHGVINHNVNPELLIKHIDVQAVNIEGITYYVDEFNHVYDTEDIMNSIQNPRIILLYEKKQEGKLCEYKLLPLHQLESDV